MRSTWRRVAAMAAVVIPFACSNPTASCESNAGLSGQWTYAATQESPVPASMSGTMVIASRQCADFQGTLDVVESFATGESRRVAGFISGTTFDSSLIRFESVIAGEAREHLARIWQDSISGDWIQSSNGAARSGRFAGHRVAGSGS